MRAVERRFDALDAGERFRLAVLARARGDTAEERRLDDACPWRTYRMADPAYYDRWRGLVDVLTRVVHVLGMFGRDHARRAALVSLADALGRTSAELCALAWLIGWEDATAAAGGAELPMPKGGAAAALGPNFGPDGTAARWAAAVGERAGNGAALAAFWCAFDAWARDTCDTSGAVLIASCLDSGDYTAGLVDMATSAAAEHGADVDAADVAELRASLDDVWARHVGRPA